MAIKKTLPKFQAELILGNETYQAGGKDLLDALRKIETTFNKLNPLGKVNARGLLKVEVGDLKSEMSLQPVFVRRFMFNDQVKEMFAKRLTNLLHK